MTLQLARFETPKISFQFFLAQPTKLTLFADFDVRYLENELCKSNSAKWNSNYFSFLYKTFPFSKKGLRRHFNDIVFEPMTFIRLRAICRNRDMQKRMRKSRSHFYIVFWRGVCRKTLLHKCVSE